MTNQKEIETIMINDKIYVPQDSVINKAENHEGLRYAIVRSRNQGVMCGYIKSINGQTVEVLNARQMWRWSSEFVLPDIAENGLTTKWENKFSKPMSQPCIMTEACGVLYCTDKAAKSLIDEKAQEF